ncbi:hypothetical protein BX591_102217 [Paraburkholderia bryophila]|uniref:Uncharacterized protein n=1 Tax=Paraburkholderia bryophila TaxID=420952 RepID=A0A329D111_9BURK|nr:hypothetical protein BX591_102217 [Paraburkholderia bryophila]
MPTSRATRNRQGPLNCLGAGHAGAPREGFLSRESRVPQAKYGLAGLWDNRKIIAQRTFFRSAHKTCLTLASGFQTACPAF